MIHQSENEIARKWIFNYPLEIFGQEFSRSFWKLSLIGRKVTEKTLRKQTMNQNREWVLQNNKGWERWNLKKTFDEPCSNPLWPLGRGGTGKRFALIIWQFFAYSWKFPSREMLKINADYLSKGMRSNDSFLLESSTVWFTNSHMLSTNREVWSNHPHPHPLPQLVGANWSFSCSIPLIDVSSWYHMWYLILLSTGIGFLKQRWIPERTYC